MKRNAFLLLTFACLLFGCGQHANKDGAEQAIPISKLNVENLLDSLDLNMDISQLPLSDLRILENVFLAQKGYPFEDSYIRSVYQTTTWYDSLMWLFDGTEENFNFPDEYNENASYRDTYYGSIKSEVLKLTDEQQAFINRIKTREAEIQATNFTPEVDGRVNMMNVVNPNLIKDINPVMWNKLGQNGFTIIPARHQQLFHVYEQNDYHEFPAFVTTDLYLQLYHLYFDCMLREVEEQQLDTMVEMLCIYKAKPTNHK